MAKAYIAEYESLAQLNNGTQLSAGREPRLADQAVTYTGTPGTSAAFNAKTKFVRLHVDGIASFAFGTAPVADTDDPRMVAGATEYFAVSPGHKVSVITNT